MFKWEKIGVVFNPSTIPGLKPWMKEFAQAPCSLIFDNFVRVYFSCRSTADANGQYVSYSAFVDFDRNELFKVLRISRQPILALGDLGTFDEFGTYPVSVIRKEDQIWAYYAGWTRCESVPFNVAIGAAVSEDGGESFKKLGKGPVLSFSPDEPFVISGPKVRFFNNKWFLWYIAGSQWVLDGNKPEPVYKIRMATSEDGVNWVKLNRDIIESRLEEDEAQASPDVFFYAGVYHMFFCYRYSKGYRGKVKGYRIGYARSNDLINWTREDAKGGIDVSEIGWDSEMVSYPHVFEIDDQIYMLYLGNQVGRFGFGAAKLTSFSK